MEEEGWINARIQYQDRSELCVVVEYNDENFYGADIVCISRTDCYMRGFVQFLIVLG